MLALIGFLQEWESTGDKTICFSQCSLAILYSSRKATDIRVGTSMLDLVEMLFGRYGIQSLRYDGSMDRAAREAVLVRFRQPGGPRVILIRFFLERSLSVLLLTNNHQYKMRWRRPESHCRESDNQVSEHLSVLDVKYDTVSDSLIALIYRGITLLSRRPMIVHIGWAKIRK